jgi:hypothetical protein
VMAWRRASRSGSAVNINIGDLIILPTSRKKGQARGKGQV